MAYSYKFYMPKHKEPLCLQYENKQLTVQLPKGYYNAILLLQLFFDDINIWYFYSTIILLQNEALTHKGNQGFFLKNLVGIKS